MFELPSEDDRRPEDLLTRRANSTCLSEAELEDFLQNRLSGTTRESVEEHILVCQTCLGRVEAEEEFTASFRVAARRIEDEDLNAAYTGSRPGWFSRLWKRISHPSRTESSLVLVFAAMLTLVVVPVLRTPSAMDVSLVAERGLASSLSAAAESGRPLKLNLDATGLPRGTLRMELAGQGGEILLSSTAPVSGNVVRWDLGRSLTAGVYWVRLHQQNPDTLLREFALTVK
jgi:hypothetical protein